MSGQLSARPLIRNDWPQTAYLNSKFSGGKLNVKIIGEPEGENKNKTSDSTNSGIINIIFIFVVTVIVLLSIIIYLIFFRGEMSSIRFLLPKPYVRQLE